MKMEYMQSWAIVLVFCLFNWTFCFYWSDPLIRLLQLTRNEKKDETSKMKIEMFLLERGFLVIVVVHIYAVTRNNMGTVKNIGWYVAYWLLLIAYQLVLVCWFDVLLISEIYCHLSIILLIISIYHPIGLSNCFLLPF